MGVPIKTIRGTNGDLRSEQKATTVATIHEESSDLKKDGEREREREKEREGKEGKKERKPIFQTLVSDQSYRGVARGKEKPKRIYLACSNNRADAARHSETSADVKISAR